MRIGIITQPLRTNYGGILQNYALQTALKRRGHTVTTLQRDRFIRVKYPRYILTLCKRILLKPMGKYNAPIFYEKFYNLDYPIFTQNTMRFVNKHINIQEIRSLDKDVSEKDFDVYVVGSDQVWRPSYNNIYHTFLSFTKGWNVKRYAYAASFGTDEWEFSEEESKICGVLIKQFDAISVREASGVDLCKKYFSTKASHVLDPTMLLKREDYESLISDNHSKPVTGQLFVHILDKTEDKTQLVNRIAKENDWEPFSVNCEVDEHEVNVPINQRIQPPLEQWLRGFKEAEYVITDSFHATVFSIIFNKPFIVYANKGRGVVRFTSLLKMFGIENRIVTETASYDESKLGVLDFQSVNQKIDEWRTLSYNFIENIL